MEKKIYVIVELNLDCNSKRLVCAFDDMQKAEEYAKELTEKHKQQSVFDEELWSEIEEEMIDFLESIDENFYVNPYEGGTEEWEKWNEEFEVFEKEKYVGLLHGHGMTDATISDVEKQIDYNFYKDTNVFVKIEELTLF